MLTFPALVNIPLWSPSVALFYLVAMMPLGILLTYLPTELADERSKLSLLSPSGLNLVTFGD